MLASGPFEQPSLETTRLILEAITEKHAAELCELFSDPELHRFVPFEIPTLEVQRARCLRWESRGPEDRSEIWLNWAARDKASGEIAAHFQGGVNPIGIATIGYVVGKKFQRQGIAFEGMNAVFTYLRDTLKVREIKAWSDTRNEASHRLAKKLGMVQVEFIKDADFFKGASSDEFVFSRSFER